MELLILLFISTKSDTLSNAENLIAEKVTFDTKLIKNGNIRFSSFFSLEHIFSS